MRRLTIALAERLTLHRQSGRFHPASVTCMISEQLLRTLPNVAFLLTLRPTFYSVSPSTFITSLFSRHKALLRFHA